MTLLQILEVAGKGLTVVNAPRSGKTTSTSSNPSVEVLSSGAASESDPKDQTEDNVVDSELIANLKVFGSLSSPRGCKSSSALRKGVGTVPRKEEVVGGSANAPGSKKRPAPSASVLSPWKKPSLKNQLRNMVIKPSVKFSCEVQVSTIPSSVAPTSGPRDLKLKAPCR
jgi:hypothetical protein